ncbi:MAG: addiction module toxin, HicA family [Caldiserica bacterium]|nr:MAG: addiction module toxin, HicA family [Caldisericota bacterium]
MKRTKILKYLKKLGCIVYREGRRHTVLWNPKNNKTSTLPRHTEIDDFLARKICRDLGVKEIK